ncbi:uncharacterized protein [Drosophila takahashii]|uniref:uncharacterized protein n=1 Tax=Drosophila takahashii TaxID=29030 RepID=UPI001CF80AA0|nr:uncharacterized protein LOC123002546 [Drosophila takahashii]
MDGAEQTVEITRTNTGKLRWTVKMELLLIDVWQENVEQLRSNRKNVHIYMEMAQSMMEAGFDIDYKDVRTKIENLTKRKISGGAPSSWQHYELLHSFLGAFRIHNTEKSNLENENWNKYFVETLDEDPEDNVASICSGSQRSGSNGPPAKRAKLDHKAELVEIARDRLDEQRAQTEIMSRMADSQAQFQTDLLELLRCQNN